jgi:hypothetical protein
MERLVAMKLVQTRTSAWDFLFPKGTDGWYRPVRTVMGQVVDNVAPKLGNLAPLGMRLATSRYLLRSLFLLLSLGFVSGSAVAGSNVRNPAIASVGPGQPFAIADFDGDHRPDSASIQAGPNSSGGTNYWIQLRLSAFGRQSIRLVALTGGLRIEARDVNGDNAIDLVLTTAWLREPVAILLNDGHGGFSQAEPISFPGAFSESRTNWISDSNLEPESVGIAPRPGANSCTEAKDLPHKRPSADLNSPSNAGFLPGSFLISHAGRAPPSEVPSL